MVCTSLTDNKVGNRAYILDGDMRIVETRGDWDSFATENGGEASLDAAILGRPIWDFVSGIDTRAFLNTVFFVCRNEGLSYSTEYRCDAPHARRVFRMRVYSDPSGLVVAHDTIDVSVPGRSETVARPRFDEACRCSMCCAIKIGEQWLDTFAVIDIKDFPKTYELCPSCRILARASLSDARATVVALRA